MAGLRIQQGSSSPKTLQMMAKRPPQLQTQRLLLRALRLADAPRVQRLAGDRAVATTLRIPAKTAERSSGSTNSRDVTRADKQFPSPSCGAPEFA